MKDATHTGVTELAERVSKATGPDREIDGELMCLHHGWRFIRYSDGNDFSPAYRDVEPGPQYEGAGGRVGKGVMLFFNPEPGGGQHHQQWSGAFTPYTASIDAAVALVEQVLPGCKVSLFKQPDGTAGARVRTNDWNTFTSYEHYDDDDFVPHYQPNGAIAILSALLAALKARSP